MKSKWIKILPFLSAVTSPSLLYAAPVTYDESINGDLGLNNSFVLGQNKNYVTGSISTGLSTDVDGFSFTIPNNFETVFSFSGAIDLGGSPYGASFSWELRRGITIGDCSVICGTTYEPYAFQLFSAGDNFGSLIPSEDENLPSISSIHNLSPGTYYLFNVGSGGGSVFIPVGADPSLNANYLNTMKYTATFNLQTVPLPSGIYLFITSLIALPSIARNITKTSKGTIKR